jgi:hypothetical protein
VIFVQAICVLIAIFMVHADYRLQAAVAMVLFATGIAVSLALITAHNRPFSGEISVSADLLLQVLPHERVCADRCQNFWFNTFGSRAGCGACEHLPPRG